ncbi:MAG TPA: hypothetical protein VNC40_02390 [Gaiellaceae bacterium]|nr:hypothetical protein [Gaiellaceae bacterium]
MNAQAVTDGKLTQTQADTITADLTTRMTNLVNNTGPMRGGGPGPGVDRGFGPPGPGTGTHM